MAKKYIVTVNGIGYEVIVEEAAIGATYNTAPVSAPAVSAPAASAPVAAPAPAPAPTPAAAPASAPADGVKVTAPLPGNILRVNVSAGASVKAGDVLCVLEAMKMENDIVAPQDGTVASVSATQGSSVNTGDLLFVIG